MRIGHSSPQNLYLIIYAFFLLRPTLHDIPGLILDREAGAQVITDSKAGKIATLRLEATVEPSEAVQAIGYSLGKHYGKPRDEQILQVNHTDDPSITLDNEALGLQAIVKYFSNLPQGEREWTLTIFLDYRHYIPGYSMAGFLGFYWSTTSGIKRRSCDHALRQIITMTQLTTFLMQVEIAEIQIRQS